MFLAHALEYAARGLHVFPLMPRSKKPYKSSHGVKDATKHRGQIRQWWTTPPDANIAIATGECSDVFALDEDPRNGGDKALAKLEAKHGTLPRTVTANTGGGGRHRYFRWPGWRVKNSKSKIGPGLDVKGDGGYIVAAPSVHDVTGAIYEWAKGLSLNDLDVADAPEWLL